MNPTPQNELNEEHTRFALLLDQELAGETSSHVWSPYSVGSVLGLLAQGAGGDTRRELLDLVVPANDGLEGHMAALDSAVTASDGLDLAALNGLYVPADLPVLPEFEDLVRAQTGAEVDRVDFRRDAEGVRRRVNGRVLEVTQGIIPELLSPGTVHPDVRMMLVNALWVKMLWCEPFEAAQTRDRPFHAPNGTHKVPTMHRTGRMAHSEHAGWRMVSLAGEHGLTLDLVLGGGEGPPQQPGYRSLAGLYAAQRPERVDLSLPRFSVVSDIALLDPMAASAARVRALATDGADFSGISHEPLKVDAIVHQSVLRVDERGAEGAAATAAVMVRSAAILPKAREFVVDRPFLFVLRRRGSILFMGRVLDPKDPGPAS